MNFQMISQSGFLLSIAGLAALVALLQILRIRYKSVPVVTNMFWREVLADAPVRSFWQKFRHLWAYLLSLLIVLLLFLAFADPQKIGENAEQDRHVFLLDASAVMGAAKRFNSSVDLMLGDLAGISRDKRRVLWVGGQVKPVLVPGEALVVLKERLKDSVPEAVPSKIEQQLLHLGKTASKGRLLVTVYGDSPVSARVLEMLPDNMIVKRAEERQTLTTNMGVSELGVSEAASGIWGLVDIYFHLTGTEGQLLKTYELNLRIEGQTLTQPVVSLEDGRFLVHDIKADGGLLEIALSANDDLAVDDVARMRLPLIEPVRVRLSESLKDALNEYLAADPAVEIVDINPDVIIRRADDIQDVDTDARHIIFTPMSRQKASFVIATEEYVDEAVLGRLLDALGLDQIDAGSMAQSGGQPIEVRLENSGQRGVALWSELLTAQFNFKKSRAFPIFMARTIRWLSKADPWFAYVAVGEEMPLDMTGNPARILGENGVIRDSLGARKSPGSAGVLSLEQNDLWASLQMPVAGKSVEDALAVRMALGAGMFVVSNVMTWILLLVMGLIFIEWRLHQTGRMP
ncbi:MAG: BatA domain-containing protein [Emcibacter sp.]|nr:BatA domain-containing protein [Emcibacter sp.]